MLKDNNKYAGQPILGQLLNYIPQHIFKLSVNEFNADAAHNTVSIWDQFTFMFYGILTGSSTLREIGKNFALFGDNLKHCEIKAIPARSSISDANRKRNAGVFGKLYSELYQYYKKDLTNSYLSSEINGEIDPSKVEIFDSTTVSLFTDIFKNTGRIPQNGSAKPTNKNKRPILFDLAKQAFCLSWSEDGVIGILPISKTLNLSAKF